MTFLEVLKEVHETGSYHISRKPSPGEKKAVKEGYLAVHTHRKNMFSPLEYNLIPTDEFEYLYKKLTKE